MTITDSTINDPNADRGGSIWTSYSTRDRTLLALGSLICYLIFHFMGRAFRIPELQDYQVSLLGNVSPVVTILMTAVTFGVCLLIGSIIAGSVHLEGGLFCACIGLVALSTRGGPMHYELMSAAAPGVWIRMVIELIILFIIVAGAWTLLKNIPAINQIEREEALESESADEATPGQGLMALAVQIVIMILLMLFLAQTDQKAQVIWSIAISAFVAALAAHQLFPLNRSAWFWCVPFIVALIGYICAMVGGSALPGGQVGGYLPGLARALPLDYAAIGPAGALFGYWFSQKLRSEYEQES